jgi:hypothetical protein
MHTGNLCSCLASHSNGDILEQKIIIHLTARNTQPCVTVITKCYLHTYHSYCIITLHFCTFPIMITSSYLLSKYISRILQQPMTFKPHLPTNKASPNVAFVRRIASFKLLPSHCTCEPMCLCLPSVGFETQPPSRTSYRLVCTHATISVAACFPASIRVSGGVVINN